MASSLVLSLSTFAMGADTKFKPNDTNHKLTFQYGESNADQTSKEKLKSQSVSNGVVNVGKIAE